MSSDKTSSKKLHFNTMKKLITTTLLMIGSTVMGKDYYSTPSMDSFRDISLLTAQAAFRGTHPQCLAPRHYKVNPKWKKDYIPQLKNLHYGFKNLLLLTEEAERIRNEANRIAKASGGEVRMSPKLAMGKDAVMPFGYYFSEAVHKGPQNIYMQYFKRWPNLYAIGDWELATSEPRKTPNLLESRGLRALEETGKKLFLYSEYFEVPSFLKDHPSVYVVSSPSSKNPWSVREQEWTSADGRKMKAAYIGNKYFVSKELFPKKATWVYFWKNEKLIPVLLRSLSEESKMQIEEIRRNRSLNTSNNLANN